MAFYDDGSAPRNIVISFSPNPRLQFWAFAKGYHLAAKQSAEAFLVKSGYSDFEGYPIVFLYRHAFELYLKNIIYWVIQLAAFKQVDGIDNKLHNTHKLVDLAKISTSLLLTLFPGDEGLSECSTKILRCASEFDEIDPTSFSYRYPIDKDGNASTKKHQVVDIHSVYIGMEELLEMLSTINAGLQGETHLAQEVYEILNDYFN